MSSLVLSLTSFLKDVWMRWWRIVFPVIAILFLVLSFGVGQLLGTNIAERRMMEALAENQHLHSEIVTTKNKYQDATKAIKQLSTEQTQLIELVAKLQKQANKPPVIRNVIVTRTIIEPAAPEFITPELPTEYRFKLEPGLEVARFNFEQGQYVFTTRRLEIKTSIVVGETQSTALLQIASDAEPGVFYDIPIDDLQVRITDPTHKLFKPQLMLGIRAGLSENPQLTAQAMLTLLHPTKCIDTVGIVVAGNNQTVQFGLSPFAYNIGCHLPVVDDLWITTDAYVDIGARFGAGLGIGSKF